MQSIYFELTRQFLDFAEQKVPNFFFSVVQDRRVFKVKSSAITAKDWNSLALIVQGIYNKVSVFFVRTRRRNSGQTVNNYFYPFVVRCLCQILEGLCSTKHRIGTTSICHCKRRNIRPFDNLLLSKIFLYHSVISFQGAIEIKAINSLILIFLELFFHFTKVSSLF